MITAVVRRSLPTAPLFGYNAPVAGSGKSMLVDMTSVIATGREAGVLAQGKTPEETEKRFASVLFAGDAVIAVDNCEYPLGGDLLCQMLTQESVRIRILGKTETPELPTGALVTATGNNLTLVGDMTRRSLVCKLDPKDERPELREFEAKPVAKAKANRGTYVSAILTILRAYIAAGRPQQVKSLGSFEAWSDLVRSALIWLDYTDPVDTMEITRGGDPTLIALQTVMTQWRRSINGRASAGNAVTAATEKIPGAEGTLMRPSFRDALLLVAGDRGMINSIRLGKWLAKNANRRITVGDEKTSCMQCYFERDGILDGSVMWQLREEAP